MLKLHLVSGNVWYGKVGELPFNTKLTVEEFAETKLPYSYSAIRMMGSYDNAKLITAVFDKYREEARIELVTPQICTTDAERREPDVVMSHMDMFTRAPALGGAHLMSASEIVPYRLAAAFYNEHNIIPDPDWVISLVKTHPVYEPMSFLSPLHLHSLGRLLARIRDPRWFIDLAKPDRENRLISYLKLEPDVQIRVSDPSKGYIRGAHVCAEVMRCWYDASYAEDVKKYITAVGFDPIAKCSTPGLQPKDFIWRIWAGHLLGTDGTVSSSPFVADLRASQYFIRFLRHIWLSVLYPESFGPPERLLRHKCELDAFVAHMAA